MPPRYKLGRC